jgi:hypothetical protein
MSPRRRSTLLRGARFFAVLVALLLPWPGLGRAYVEAFSRVGTAAVRPVFAGSGLTLALRLFPETDEHHEWYSMIFVTDAQTGAPLHMGAADLKRSGYLQIAIFVAAAAAFPLRRRRLYSAILVGGALVLATLGWLPIFMYLAKKQIIHLGAWSYAALSVTERSLVAAPGMAFAVPMLQWLLALRLFGWPAGGRNASVSERSMGIERVVKM